MKMLKAYSCLLEEFEGEYDGEINIIKEFKLNTKAQGRPIVSCDTMDVTGVPENMIDLIATGFLNEQGVDVDDYKNYGTDWEVVDMPDDTPCKPFISVPLT